MKRKEQQLQIEKPCLAHWDAMKPNTLGRHCDHCAKQVYDATNLTPEEIFKIFIEQKGNACMRVPSNLLEEPFVISLPEKKFSVKNIYRNIALFVGMQMLIFQQIKAQINQLASNDKLSDGTIKSNTKSICISGTVAFRKDTFPLENMKIELKRNNIVLAFTQALNDGSYVLEIPNYEQAEGRLSMVFSHPNYSDVLSKPFSINKPRIFMDTVYFDQEIKQVQTISSATFITGGDMNNRRASSMSSLYSVGGAVNIKYYKNENDQTYQRERNYQLIKEANAILKKNEIPAIDVNRLRNIKGNEL